MLFPKPIAHRTATLEELVMQPENILLILDDTLGSKPDQRVRDDLSAVARVEDTLWLGCDEGAYLERLTKEDEHAYRNHQRFALDDILNLPADDDEDREIDIEGLDISGGYLWLVGSHSLKRRKPKNDKSESKNLKRLRTVKREANRYIFARIPMVKTDDGYIVVPQAESLLHPGQVLTAQQLPGDEEGNVLLEALSKDKYLGPFTHIPSKDNGLDVEGLAVSKDTEADTHTVFLGLRGPVLRGWAVILRLRITEADGHLKLLPSGADQQPYTKQFLQLDGYGVRDLLIDGNDLLILAGATMDLEGPVVVYRWNDALLQEKETLVWSDQLEKRQLSPCEKSNGNAEGLARLKQSETQPLKLLVVYDSPKPSRRQGDFGVWADAFDL